MRCFSVDRPVDCSVDRSVVLNQQLAQAFYLDMAGAGKLAGLP
jgi:hypothetical protein